MKVLNQVGPEKNAREHEHPLNPTSHFTLTAFTVQVEPRCY